MRHKLALVMLGQCTVLLVLASWTLLTLGTQMEVREFGADLRTQAGHLAAVVAPSTGALTDVDLASGSVPDRALQSALQQADYLDQINLFQKGERGFILWREISLSDEFDRRAWAERELENPAMVRAVHAATVDEAVRWRGDREVFSAYAPVKNAAGETIGVLTLDANPEAVHRHANLIRPILLIVLLVAVGLAMVLAPWLSGVFFRPIDELVRATDKVAQGDFTAKVNVKSSDEMGRLSASFNRMTDTVRGHQTDLQNNNRQLDLLNRQLRDTMVELEQVNEDLSESRNFFSTLVARTPSPIVVTDPDHRIILFNEAASDLFGYRPDEIVGETFDRLFSQENRAGIREHMAREVHRGREWRGEFYGRTKSGDRPMLSATVSPVRDDHDQVLAYMYLAFDITETRKLQDLIIQMEHMSTRGEMAGEIAHEINNYLTILGGNLDVIPMLVAAGHSEKVQKKFAAMREVLDKIARFSDGLMGYRDTDTEPVVCNLNRVVEGVVSFLKPQKRYDRIHIELHLDEELPDIRVNVGQIQQVLVNLLNNAADAIGDTQRDDGKIEIETVLQQKPGNALILVRDNGVGIAPDVAGRLFHERFTNKSRGHGLGLLNCRRIVEAHNGRLEVESQLGNGAAFTVSLPAEDVTESLPPPVVRVSSDA